MSTFQKIAALIFRLAAVALILYACIFATATAMIMPHAIWMLLPFFVGGMILYFAALPLAWLVTRGFDE